MQINKFKYINILFLLLWKIKSKNKKTIKNIFYKIRIDTVFTYAFVTRSKYYRYQLSPDPHYHKLIQKNRLKLNQINHIHLESINLHYKPLISIILPVYNTPEKYLREAIQSVFDQAYPYWELCIVDDASPAKNIKVILSEYSTKDKRIKVVYRDKNGHISKSSNSALAIATGEFVALLDHDDLLTKDALYEVALLLNRHPEADMIYSDEDKIDKFYRLKDPFFKPDWCPDSFFSRMYTCHLGVYRRELVNKIGGFREGFEGSQDYDLVLRIAEVTNNIFHIPKILYHWRIHSNSTASSITCKDYAPKAAYKAIHEALIRRQEPGKIIPVNGGHQIVRYQIKEFKLVSIIIPTKNLGKLLNECITSIFKNTEYPNFEVIVIDNGSTDYETIHILNTWKENEPNRFRIEDYDKPFNFSRINNHATTIAKGELFLFLNNDTKVLTKGWINALVEQAQRSSIGAVGTLLLYPDNTIQHAGVIIGIGDIAGHSHRHFPSHFPGYVNQIQTINNYSAVTGACLMCRREVFQEIGGFDEELAFAFNDVDLCLNIIQKGYRNVYLPHVVLYHYESKSRGYDNSPKQKEIYLKEVNYMRNKWGDILKYDPCYNINLTNTREDYGLRI